MTGRRDDIGRNAENAAALLCTAGIAARLPHKIGEEQLSPTTSAKAHNPTPPKKDVTEFPP